MKNQALFSSKDKSKNLKCHLLQFLFGALRVNLYIVIGTAECKNHNPITSSILVISSLTFLLVCSISLFKRIIDNDSNDRNAKQKNYYCHTNNFGIYTLQLLHRLHRLKLHKPIMLNDALSQGEETVLLCRLIHLLIPLPLVFPSFNCINLVGWLFWA